MAARLLLFICVMISCPAMAQPLTSVKDSLTVGAFFRLIETQTPYTFAYSHVQVDSAMKISVPAGNIRMEDALSHLSRETPYTFEITGNHIIVYPRGENRSYPPEEKQFVVKGRVAERQTMNMLPYASVCLLDAAGNVLSASITDATGVFRLITGRVPHQIKISFIGYETLVDAINGADEDAGVFLMETSEHFLDEITVAGRTVKADRTAHRITPEMYDGTFDAMDLLGKIHGLDYDKSAQTVKVDDKTNILLTVNGMKQSPDYINSLPSRQIRMIEVIREPHGRFVSDGYDAVINFIRDENRKGYNIFASNISAVNFSRNNGKDRLAEELPLAGVSFFNPKTDFYASYSFEWERWNLPMEKKQVYGGDISALHDPNSLYRSQRHNAALGMNYRANRNHAFSLRADYATGNMYSEYAYTAQKIINLNISNRSLKNTTENLTIDRIVSGSLSYDGKINDRLHLHGDLTWNYYFNDMENRFEQKEEKTVNRNENLYNEYKNHALFNLETSYLLSATTALEAGYSGSRRIYASESSIGKGFLDYNEYRHVFFVSISCNPAAKIKAKAGLGAEAVRIRNQSSVNNLILLMPYLTVKYKPVRRMEIDMNYTAAPRYPELYRLSPMSLKVDSLLTQVGNPALLPALRHTAAIRFNWGDRLTLEPSFRFTHNDFSETYMINEYRLYRTFRNIDTREYAISARYDRPVGKYIRLTGGLTFYRAQASCEGIENTADGWLARAETNFYHPASCFGIQLGYSRNMKKHILWQGYQQLGKDSWQITASRIFPKKGLSIMLSCTPPIYWGVEKEQTKQIATPLYGETTRVRLGAYYNMLLLKINYRFSGKK
ncbi:MAG: outer membrane beta-barrel protein [Dysgonamonadaceae bacterium]|jgi:hypothetical protein|nr:outer membrane beta-barrel protein [Dysgonamonadaceae bacterium]